MAELTVVHRDAIAAIATARNLLVVVWSDAPTLAQMAAFGRSVMAARRTHPGGVALLSVIRSGTPRFSDGVRDEARRLTSEGGCSLGSAHLVIVPGLAGSATRAFLSTVNLLARPAVPTRVFGDPADALAWLGDRLGTGAEPWTAAELEDAYKRALAL